MLLVSACSSVPALDHTQPSAQQLAQAVLTAVGAGDRARLQTLALSEREFRDHVWPALPSARPERNLPFSYVWGDLRQKSDQSLARTLARHAGQRYSLVDVRFDGTTEFAASRVHRQATFVVTDPSGSRSSLQLCGSFLEQAGQWKVFSYVVDD